MLIEEKRQDIYIVFVSFLQIKLNTCPLRAEYHHIGDRNDINVMPQHSLWQTGIYVFVLYK